jgi:hypothetical protein
MISTKEMKKGLEVETRSPKTAQIPFLLLDLLKALTLLTLALSQEAESLNHLSFN